MVGIEKWGQKQVFLWVFGPKTPLFFKFLPPAPDEILGQNEAFYRIWAISENRANWDKFWRNPYAISTPFGPKMVDFEPFLP